MTLGFSKVDSGSVGPGRGLETLRVTAGNHLQASVLAQGARKCTMGGREPELARCWEQVPTSTCLQAELGVWAQSLWSLGEDQKGGALDSSPGQMMPWEGSYERWGTCSSPFPPW